MAVGGNRAVFEAFCKQTFANMAPMLLTSFPKSFASASTRDRSSICRVFYARFAHQNSNFLRVNKNCSAGELHAIMQDHYELMQNLNDTPLGRHTYYSPRQTAQKSKKKKFSSELEEKVQKREDVVSFQRMFSVFERPVRNLEALMTQVVALNKNCDGKDRNAILQEVRLQV